MMIKPTYLLWLLFLVVVGCASPRDKGVTVGMDMDEVESLAGAPTRVKKHQCKKGWKNCIVIWQYDGYNVSFSDGIVDSTQ